MALPESYRDPVYDAADTATSQKLGLPVGLLSSIRTIGERSNNSQVSSAGAQTPYQFIPSTKKAILDKFGIDVTLSPELASEGAGLLLRDSLKRNNGDAELAVREYHGGLDPKNWGPVNNAYAGRVMAGQQKSKIAALSDGFGKFLAQNPAAPAPAAPAAAAKPDALSAGFGDWLADQNRPRGAAAIPLDPGAREQMDAEAAARGPVADPTLVDKVIGAGEAGLTMATGMTGGMLGTLGGAAQGLAGSVMDGTFGTQQGVQAIDKAAGEGAAALTYQPRTESGQAQAGAIGEGMAAILPALPLTAEMAALGRGAAPAARAAGDVARATPVARMAGAAIDSGVTRIRSLSPAIAERVERTLRRTPETPAPTPGTRASGGSAGADMATQRNAAAADLPVPIKLTRGQATRDPDQLRFELETAKGDQGAPLRNRYSDQNEQIVKNFDSWVDQTGAEAITPRAVGTAVDKALVERAARDKAEIRVAYKNAEKSGEGAAPVELRDLVDHLNDAIPDVATAPIIDTAINRAIRLGIAAKDDSGALVAQPVTLRTAEAMRQAISQAADPAHAPNLRQATIIKGLIDAQTETAGGPLYRQARSLRARYATQYENRAVVRDLLRKDRSTQDRKVALEDVWKHAIKDGSLDDVRQMRKILQTGGADGQQAWKELQGQTITWLKDEATKRSATDQRGNTIFSADGLNKAIRQLDQDGKLDFIFGKKGAEQLRDMNDLAKVVFTAPPGVVNTSNTASVVLAALAESAAAGAVIGIPAPVITGLKFVHRQAKKRALNKRIDASLDGESAVGRPPAPQP